MEYQTILHIDKHAKMLDLEAQLYNTTENISSAFDLENDELEI